MAAFSLKEQKGGVTQSTWLVEADTTGLCGQGLLTGTLGLVHSWLFLTETSSAALYGCFPQSQEMGTIILSTY